MGTRLTRVSQFLLIVQSKIIKKLGLGRSKIDHKNYKKLAFGLWSVWRYKVNIYASSVESVDC